MEGSGRAPILVIRLLGRFAVSVGDRAVGPDGWRLRKGRHVLALLALAPGQALHREQLADALWPAHNPGAAAANLRQALHAARRVLSDLAGAPWPTIVAEGERLALYPSDQVQIDVVAFEAAAEAARRRRHVEAYRAALALYSGDLLPDDLYEDWAAERREALRAHRLALLAELAESEVGSGDLPAAITTLERLVAEEPTHEVVQRQLLTLYARAGRRQRALHHYQQLREHLRAELDTEPEPATRALVERIATGRLALPAVTPSPPPARPGNLPPARPGNLPAALARLIGRDDDLAAISERLAGRSDSPRLLTLTGAGGVGKTQLALAVAHRVCDGYTDGAWLVDLAPLADASLVPTIVAAALGIRASGGRDPVAALMAALRRQRLLLVLDNCEHLVEACAPLIQTLLEGCPAARVLATSRVAVGVSGEVRWRVSSLALPDPSRPDAAAIGASPAVTLFVERARQVEPAFALTGANANAVMAICQRLDGIPLALELAAARLAVLTPAQLAERLDDALAVLTGGPRSAPPRQRTLRATLDWSYGLLAESDRRLLPRLAVFAGGFTLAAAEAVGDDGLGESASVLEGLARLIDASLVVVEAGEPPRYRLLEPVRQDARRRLVAEGVAEIVQRRHADYYLALAEPLTMAHRDGASQPAHLRAVERDDANLRAALHWAITAREAEYGLRLVTALAWYWMMRGALREGWSWAESALALDSLAPAPLRLEALILLAGIAYLQQDHERTTTIEEALALAESLGDRFGIERANQLLGLVSSDRGEFDRARYHYRLALDLARELDQTLVQCHITNNLATLDLFQGNLPGAQALLAQASALRPVLGATRTDAYLLLNLATMAYLSGDLAEARQRAGGALGVLRELGDEPFLLVVLALSIGLASRLGAVETAARLVGAVEGLTAATGGTQLPSPAWTILEPDIAAARSALGAAAFEAARVAGHTLGWPEALVLAEQVAGQDA